MVKKSFSLALVFVLLMSLLLSANVISVGAASAPSFTINSVTNLSASDAKISARITNPARTKITKVGFQLGTTSSSLSTNKYDSVNMTYSYVDASYLMSKYKVSLKANTTYYYRFYMVTGGKTYYSSIKSFKTKADSSKPTFSSLTHSSVKYNDAKVSVKVNNPAQKKITEVGVKIYSTNGEFSKTLTEKQNITLKSFDLYYLMSNNKAAKVTLIADRTYKYQFYIVANGYGKLTSGTGTFSTPKKPTSTTAAVSPTEIYFPLTKNQVWSASTYQGHGKAFGAAYSSVDIVLKNGRSAEGYGVYAAEAGKVIYYDAKNGQIVIQHTKKLVTTNKKTYTKWYTVYAHMKKIEVKKGNTVKRGQLIGHVSKVGNATGPHLHFNIISGNGNTAWNANNKNKAISPYYVKGFVQANGKDTAYCKCDRKGPAVTATLINWKPSGK